MANAVNAEADGDIKQNALAIPSVDRLKDGEAAESQINMERSISMDIREEREDLKKAAEQSLNAMLQLNLEGNIRWISPSWQDLTGIPITGMINQPIANYLTDKRDVFSNCIEHMRKDDSKSRIIRFTAASPSPSITEPISPTSNTAVDDKSKGEPSPLSLASPATPKEQQDVPPTTTNNNNNNISLEAQGIMVYDRVTGEENHTMWMIKPAISREITIDLPEILVDALGIGAEILANYLTSLAESGVQDTEQHPPPNQVMCRICERQITPWWFEKHTELCSQEHRAEMEVQLAHDNLNEQRSALVKVLDALETQARHVQPTPTSTSGDTILSPPPNAEYKGLPIGSNSNTSPIGSTGRGSPGSTPRRSRESSASGFGHYRARSFAVRRPLARIVELVLDLCDTAMEISTPAIKDTKNGQPGEIRSQSPQRMRSQHAIFGGSEHYSETPAQADVRQHQLKHGDIVIFGTDGVWDNLSAQDTLGIVTKVMEDNQMWSKPHSSAGSETMLNTGGIGMLAKEIDHNTDDKFLPGVIASAVMKQAKLAGLDRRRNGPFAREVKKYYPHEAWQGGKPDDIAVVVAIAVEQQDDKPLKAKL